MASNFGKQRISPMGLQLLRVISASGGPMTVAEMAETIGQDHTGSTMRSLTASLKYGGWVVNLGRAPNTTTRAALWDITPAGERLLHESADSDIGVAGLDHLALSRAMGVLVKVPARVIETARRVDRGMDRDPRRQAA